MMEFKTNLETAYYGDSLTFTVNPTDAEVPLSVIKAQLIYGDEVVSEKTIRTKVSGQDYTARLYVPFAPGVGQMQAKLRLELKNINLTTSEVIKDLTVTTADYPYLTLINEDGTTYRMDKTAAHQYAYTGNFGTKVKASILAKACTPNGNDVNFGWSNNAIADNCTSPIPFSSFTAGTYTISFNTESFVGAPFAVIKANGKELVSANDENTLFKGYLELTQGQEITFDGITLNEFVWADPDYFTFDKAAGKMTFNPVDGEYTLTIDKELGTLEAFRSEKGKAASMTADFGRAIYIYGWGCCHIWMKDQVGWDDWKGYCLAEVAPHVFQYTAQAGLESTPVIGARLRTDWFGVKFFMQLGWGGEFSGDNNIKITEGAKKYITYNNGDINPVDDKSLEYGHTYRFTVDLTGGIEGGIIDFAEVVE